MIIKAIYEINDRYVIGDDKHIYRLPYLENKRHRKIRCLKKHRGCYKIDGVYVPIENIKYKAIDPYELINDEIIPF
jgi:hypothetical protein